MNSTIDGTQQQDTPEDSAAFVREVTQAKLDLAIDTLQALGSPSYSDIARAAIDIGIPAWALRACVVAKEASKRFSADPFTLEELAGARLNPPWIVENYLYRDLAVLAAPGSANKTTLSLWEYVHIVLGRMLYGRPTVPARVLFITGEDQRETIGARLSRIMSALDDAEKAVVLESLLVLDLTGQSFRLCELDKHGNTAISPDVDRLIDAVGPLKPGIIHLDPLASFGAPEVGVNDAAQGAVNASRRIIRDLECCVRLVHHTGQLAARENTRDQYAPRGGSALSDGCRMVAVLSRLKETEYSPFPEGGDVFMLSQPKNSYCPPQPDIFIKRDVFSFEYSADVQRSKKERLSDTAAQLAVFLADQLKSNRHHTRNSLDPLANELRMSRAELRSALNELTISGRLTEKELPRGEKRGRRKAFLCPSIGGGLADSDQ